MISQRLYQYGLLMRLHRPIGTLLLVWPMLMAFWFASKGQPRFTFVILFIVGAFVMRSAGCVINDIADRNFDGHVQRTKDRPLAAGNVSVKEASFLFFLLLMVAFAIVCCTNFYTVILSILGGFLAFCYPFTKRYIHFPQVVLGASFGWAIPMAYGAQNQSLPVECWLLFAATLLWAVAYDTLYAMVDREDDKKIGIKSTAIIFGAFDKFWIGLCHFLMLGLLVLVGQRLALKMPYYAGISLAMGLVLYQQWLIRDRDPQACFRAFLNNQWLGAFLFLGTILSYSSNW